MANKLVFNPLTGNFDVTLNPVAPSFTGPVTLTEVVGSSGLTITGATQTASFPALSITQTWNNAGVTFTGVKVNVTNTASAAASNLLDIQVGGVSQLSLSPTGGLTLNGVSSASANIYSTAQFRTGCLLIGFNNGAGGSGCAFGSSAGNVYGACGVSGFLTPGYYSFSPTTASAAPDLILTRDAANTLAQRNSTSAQTFRLYNTYTDASNYERGFFQYSSNVLQIGHEAAGTGTANRTIQFRTNGVAAMSLDTNAMTMGVSIDLVTGRIKSQGSLAVTLGTSNSAPFDAVNPSGNITATSNYEIGFRYLRTIAPTATSTLVAVPVYIAPTINYSNATPGAGSYEALKIAVTETALPTGTNYLIRASAGAAGTTEKFSVTNAGLTTWADAANLVFGTSTGTKIGTATTQKLGFWNATPIVQPTTAIAAATFTANAGTAVNDASTFDGYTLNQIVKALRNMGLLA